MSGQIWIITAALFSIGLTMVIARRQLLAMLLGVELMVSAVNISLVYHACLLSDEQALAAVLLIVAIAAAEAVVGLSLIVDVRESGRSAESPQLTELRG
jgi:NADH-quinone oxidoreductase subunit K